MSKWQLRWAPKENDSCVERKAENRNVHMPWITDLNHYNAAETHWARMKTFSWWGNTAETPSRKSQNSLEENVKLIRCGLAWVITSKPNFGEISFKTTQRPWRKWNFLTTTHQHNPFFETQNHKTSMWKVENPHVENPKSWNRATLSY